MFSNGDNAGDNPTLVGDDRHSVARTGMGYARDAVILASTGLIDLVDIDTGGGGEESGEWLV
jgi:hypothetical protein